MSRIMSFPGKGTGLNNRVPSGSKGIFYIIKRGNNECPENREELFGGSISRKAETWLRHKKEGKGKRRQAQDFLREMLCAT